MTNNSKQINLEPVGFFATPESMEAMQAYIESVGDITATITALMMYNLLVSKYDMYEKVDRSEDNG